MRSRIVWIRRRSLRRVREKNIMLPASSLAGLACVSHSLEMQVNSHRRACSKDLAIELNSLASMQIER